MSVHIPSVVIEMIVFGVIVAPIGFWIANRTKAPYYWLVVFAVVWQFASDFAEWVAR